MWLVAAIAIDRAVAVISHGALRRCKVVAAVLWDHASGRFVKRSELWPYGPASHHEAVCVLFEGATYCDCKASDASDTEWGEGGYLDTSPAAVEMRARDRGSE